MNLSGTNGEFRIPRVEEKHAGNYKCVAVNDIGSNSHVTTLIVQGKTIFRISFVNRKFYINDINFIFDCSTDPPKITTVHTAVYKSNEGAALLKLPCVATGNPKPAIIWKRNGATITPSKI